MLKLPRLSWRTSTLTGLVVLATGCGRAVTEPTSIVCDPARPVLNELRDAQRTAQCPSMSAADPAELRPAFVAR